MTTIRQPFMRGGKFIVNKPISFAGKRFKVGDNFPWRKMACDERRLRQLFEGRFLRLRDEELKEEPILEEELEEEESEDTETEPTDEELKESADEGSEESEPFIFDPEVHEIVTRNGKKFIAADGTELLQVPRKEARRLAALREPGPVKLD